MATYSDIRSLLWNDDALRNRIAVACTIAADQVAADSANFPTATADSALIAAREAWAVSVFDSPEAAGRRMTISVIAANNTLSVAQIQGASDAAIQSRVDARVDLMATRLT